MVSQNQNEKSSSSASLVVHNPSRQPLSVTFRGQQYSLNNLIAYINTELHGTKQYEAQNKVLDAIKAMREKVED
jgi:cell fate (sporulation/competence/biofilm development) regulator YmcA (YheA/YmcA/DUF963 family)